MAECWSRPRRPMRNSSAVDGAPAHTLVHAGFSGALPLRPRGEGRGEVGEVPSSELRRHPPHPPHRLRDGSPPSPPAVGRRGKMFAAWLKTPPGLVTILILATFLARLVFAAALGLGLDESHIVAAGRKLQLRYVDHPPLYCWL